MSSDIGIAELKAHLSEYVRAAQKGTEITIRDRQTPVAKLTPVEPQEEIGEVRKATRSMAEVQKMLDAHPSGPILAPGTLEKLLEEERADQSDEWIATGI